VDLDRHGYIKVDRRLATNIAGIWAAGDAHVGPQFTHTAWDDYRILMSQIAGDGSRTTDRIVPYAMFTDPERIRRKDPGRPDVCNLFQFHKLFSNAETIARVDRECRAAEIGCVDDKKLLAEIMIESLRPIREKREEIDRDPSIVWDVLRDGNRKARERAQETMQLVRDAVKINYSELR